MKKNDKINLDSISNINEKIIDEVTDKKILLSRRSGGIAAKTRKKWVAIGSLAASFVLICSVLLVIIIPLLGFDVPVYQGMTIRQASTSSMNIQEYDFSANGITLLSASSGNNGFVFLSGSNGNGNGNAYGHDKDNHKDKDDKPKNDIEDIVVIDVKTDDEVRYYVKPGETFIIEIHIDNPKDYEIQSFTLNGKKYANYMFKEGSTMELLLLEVTAPEEPGYVEYTIDAIKYIDGTEIKDVDMSSGDKSIKAGIAYPEAPTAMVTSQSILPTSVTLSVTVTDPCQLIGENELAIYLSDGESVISSKPLTVGENQITFDNLTMNKTYEYGIVTAFDLVDGKDLHKEWLLTNTVTTAGAFGINNAISTQNSISFEVVRVGEVGTVTSVSLYDAATDELVEIGGPDIREFTGLLSNHVYNLYVDFTYTVNGEAVADWVAIKGIETLAKTAPTILFSNINPTETTVTGAFTMYDPNQIGSITSVDLYRGNTLIRGNAEKEINFTGLESYTRYKIVVTYTFDQNDGKGIQTATNEYNFTTALHLTFISCKIINSYGVKEGETIYMQVDLDNPSGALPKSVVVNGRTYNCSTTTTETRLFLEITNNGQFEGGNTTLTIEKIHMTIDGQSHSITVTENNSDSIFIRVNLEKLTVIEDFGIVVNENGAYVERDYLYPSDEAYLRLTLAKQELYDVDTVTLQLYYEEEKEGTVEYYMVGDPISVTDLTDPQNGSYFIRVLPTVYGNIKYDIQITYSSLDRVESASSSASTSRVYRLMFDEVKEISSPEDLLNMNEGYYYKQINPIDLEGINWTGAAFNGVFDGCGYSISNLSYVGTLSGNGDEYFNGVRIGLFTKGMGVIQNVNLKNVILIIDTDRSAHVGALVGDGYATLIENCHVDSESIIILTAAPYSYVGGLAGVGGCIIDSSNAASIQISCSEYVEPLYYGGGVGGIAGTGSADRCANYGTVSGIGNVGGIIGEPSRAVIVNCANYAPISGGSQVGGIAGSAYQTSFINCANFAPLTSNSNGGLICGRGDDATFKNCVNAGVLNDHPGGYSIIPFPNEHEIINCYAHALTNQLNSKSFYTDLLGWSEDIWNLDELSAQKGKYPTLK